MILTGEHDQDGEAGNVVPNLLWRPARLPALPIEGTDMARVHLSFFVELGVTMMHVDQSMSRDADEWLVSSKAEALSEHLRSLLAPEFGVSAARNAIGELISRLDSLRALHPKREDAEHRLSYHQAFMDVDAALWKAYQVLGEELDTLPCYMVVQQASYNMNLLISDARGVLPEGTRDKLPEKALDDIDQAGKCLAFECYTAVGFHLWRAVEAVLEPYYSSITGHALPGTNKSWGAYEAALHQDAEGETDKTAQQRKRHVHCLLQGARKLYRNEIMHPEAVLGHEEALRMFLEAQTAITAMADLM